MRSDALARAACGGTHSELWFGPTESEESYDQRVWRQRRALNICAQCPIRRGCLAEELARPIEAQHGVRGGMTARQRGVVIARWRRFGWLSATQASATVTDVEEMLDADGPEQEVA